MPRFVVLTHDYPEWHWDFMLEQSGVLRTWRISRAPDEEGPISAESLSDHRLHYLDYEGPVSGNRGEVRRWDQGDYAVEADIPGQLRIRLMGQRLKGTAQLIFATDSAAWQFLFCPD